MAGVEEGCSDGASRRGVRYPAAGLANFGVKGVLFDRWKAALRVGVKGLARWPAFCLSEVILAGFEGRQKGGRTYGIARLDDDPQA